MKSLLIVSILFLTVSCGSFGKIQYRKCEKELKTEVDVKSTQLAIPSTQATVQLIGPLNVEVYNEEDQLKTAEIELKKDDFFEFEEKISKYSSLIPTTGFQQELSVQVSKQYPNYPNKRKRFRWSFTEVLFAFFVIIGITAGFAAMLGAIVFLTPMYSAGIFLMRYGIIVFLSSWLLGVAVTLFDPSLH